MKWLRCFDIVLISCISSLLCGFVLLRVVTKEVLIDRLGMIVPNSQYILHDLNTTIEFPEEDENSTNHLEYLYQKYQHKLEAYTTSAMIWNQQINLFVQEFDKQIIQIPATYANERCAVEPSAKVVDFSDFLKSKEIPFVYVSTPLYDSILCCMGEKELYENQLSECNWFLLQNLEREGIDTLVLAQFLADRRLEKYDVSSHWFPECALYSTEVVAEKLNEYGFKFDLDCFDINNSWDCLAGEQELVNGLEQEYGYFFSLPVPNCTDDMVFVVEHNGTEWTGRFEDVFFQIPEEVNDHAYHNCMRISNNTLYQYHNLNATNNRGKRILIIGDSFNWILSAYLASDIEYIDVIHNASFSDSIRQYIDSTNPDMVLVIYNDAEFANVYTEEAFNFD